MPDTDPGLHHLLAGTGCIQKGIPFDPSLIQYISPIEWKNVILYGEIKIDPKKLKPRNP